MSMPLAMPERKKPPLRRRVAGHTAVIAARLLARTSPRRICRILALLARGARPCSAEDAQRARDTVVAVSALCAGEGCLPRSLATVLLCRMTGTQPTWCTGVRTEPFRAHAWVEVGETPVGEPWPAGYYRPMLRVRVA
ncbi:lasso peptide biosynthesis B2 protein [Streptomyces ureilyticus]|uniref:Lasso peptide biosynthesis B2 protein n=1 Tax=Streptomyces ureilyticus TaxID=1775131 RepID=A0ABX0E4N0_9ACTN|nr:lasso peptide biosynthesis B2 protein [Streptomyces ureilyticus]NGO47840.1 lasso peptide biosynthesis B2 protein [Streptomyces ureilyticus]